MKKNRGILVLVLTVVVVILLGFTAIWGWGPTHTGSARNINLGLDLSGGVSITYQSVENNPSSEDMSDTIYKLQKRVEEYSTEAKVYQEGDDRINVEIPGVTDANEILEELGTPGSLEFVDENGDVVLEGSDVANAEGQAISESSGTEYIVSLTLTDDATEKFAEVTSENVGKTISIVYDGEVISSPTVKEAITSGSCQIDGMASLEEARELASFIRIGGLNLELTEIRSSVVAAQLGVDAICTSLIAAIIGLIVIMIFMIIVYRVPGVVASLALLFYTALVLIIINAFDITLTLPGIAGIILGIGMAVDANVIIYARIREEIAAGISVRNSIQAGFQKAFTAIFDGNITTLIASLVLMWLGSGTVKGFAYTLALGIVVSMFTSLVVSRFLIRAVYAVGIQDEKFYGRARQRKVVDFVGKRHIFFVISIVLILCCPVGMAVHSSMGDNVLNFGLDFVGGTSTTVTFNEDLPMEEIDDEVIPLIEDLTNDANVQATKVVDTNQVIFKTRELSLDERTELDEMLVDEFGVDQSLIESESISSTVSSEMQQDAILAVIVATICMLLYIWLRFRDIRFAGSAVLALLHDVLVVLAFYALARVSVGNTFIACMLTLVGYSINATIVIFDRIRENMKGGLKGKDLKQIVNSSITQTLTRSIYTSITTFIMVFFLYILGVSSIREFALPLMVGIICGGYSSVCITGSLWYVMKNRQLKRLEQADKKKHKKK